MKKVLVIAPFEFSRFHYIADELSSEGIDVLFLTSSFGHLNKQQKNTDTLTSHKYITELIQEPGYKKNVSIKRGLSHIILAKNLKQKLKTLKKPDLIYCAYPTMGAAYVAGKYSKANKIPFIIDVIDTWPESISVALDTKKNIVKALMWPFSQFANHIYSMADHIFAVSKTYAERAHVKRSKCKSFTPIYLGTELEKFNQDSLQKNLVKKVKDEFWVTYIGTLSYSYDISTAIKAFKILKEQKDIRLNILGNGPELDELIELAKSLGVFNENVKFHGFVEYDKMLSFLKKSDIGLHALTANSRGTITLKISDYISAGLPILNSSQEEEIKELISKNQLGLNYTPGDPDSLVNAINSMKDNKNKLKFYAQNSLNLAADKFDRNKTHKVIIKVIRNIIDN